jgi:uncharacterized protein
MSSRRFSRPRPTARDNPATPFRAVLTRRALLGGAGAAALAAALPPRAEADEAAAPSSLTFGEPGRAKDARDRWPAGYRRQVLVRWGDPVLPDAPPFDPARPDAAAQAAQFGYNNDLTVYLPLPWGGASSDHGLLVVSHEYAAPHLMWPGLDAGTYREAMSAEQVRAVKAAVGLSVLEVRKDGDAGWRVVHDAGLNRRVTLDTPVRLSGPCAGHARTRTAADPEGRTVLGALSNCNGGLTPWGTVLSGEEGAMDFFAGDHGALPDPELVARQGWDEDENDAYGLGRLDARFRLGDEPNEWNRFDWVVELDPFDPSAPPVKRTALGRFTHEGAQCAVAPDGRVVVLMGDDDDFEYVCRFVTARPWDPDDRAANRDLLDEGTLSVARFGDDGTLAWLPLVHGRGPLTAGDGFADQAEVLFRTRQAADALGATPMDAAEGFVANLARGRVYLALTENEDRAPAGAAGADPRTVVNAANPRGPNPEGHILELVPPADREGRVDWAAAAWRWEVFCLCGDPAEAPGEGARFHPATSRDGWFTDPDNLGCDPAGRLWVCTDGPPGAGFADALYAMDTDGPGRGLPRLFYTPPVGSECCSPWFTPDGRTLFVSVQHPGELRADGGDAASVAEMETAWPDFAPGVPARPSVVVLSREDGGVVGA